MTSVNSSQTLALLNVAGLGQINVAAEMTTAAVATQFTNLITNFSSDLNAFKNTGGNGNPNSVAADIQQLLQLAQNGTPDPNIPGTNDFLTTEMAEVIGQLNASLQASGINIPTTGTPSVSATLLNQWINNNSSTGNLTANPPIPAGILSPVQDTSVNPPITLFLFQVSAQLALQSNHSVQSMIDMDYISAGNDVLASQMDSLSKAISTLQGVTNELNFLQNLQSNLAAPQPTALAGDPNSLPKSDGDGGNRGGIDTLSQWAKTAWSNPLVPMPISTGGSTTINGVTVPTQMTNLANARTALAQLYTQLQGDGTSTGPNAGTNPVTVPVPNTPPYTPTFTATLQGSILKVIADIDSYIGGTASTGAVPNPPIPGTPGGVPTIPNDIITVTDSNMNPQFLVINPGSSAPVMTTVAANTVLSLFSSNSNGQTITVNGVTYNNVQVNATSVNLNSSLTVPQALGMPTFQYYNAGSDTTESVPPSIPVSYDLVPNESGNTSSFYSLTATNGEPLVINDPIYGSNYGVSSDGVNPTDNASSGTTSGTQPWIPTTGSPPTPVAFSKIQVNFTPNPNNLTQPIVTYTVYDPSGNPITTPLNFTMLRVTTGVTEDENGNTVTTAAPVVPIMRDSVWGWILDYQDANSGIAATNSGLVQQDLSAATVGAQNLNQNQQQQMQEFMFIFQEFYQSAASVLAAINTLVTSQAKGINGQGFQG